MTIGADLTRITRRMLERGSAEEARRLAASTELLLLWAAQDTIHLLTGPFGRIMP